MCFCVFMYIYIYTHTHTYIQTRTEIEVYEHDLEGLRVLMRTLLHDVEHINTYIYMCMCVYVYKQTHVCMHTYRLGPKLKFMNMISRG